MKKYEVVAPFWHKGVYVDVGTEVPVGGADAVRLELGGYIKEPAAPVVPVVYLEDILPIEEKVEEAPAPAPEPKRKRKE